MAISLQSLRRCLAALLLIAFLAPVAIHAQTRIGKADGSDGDEGDEKEQFEKVKESNPYKRMEWFYGQRGLLDEEPPLPADEMYNMLREEMAKDGYHPGDADAKYETNTALGGLNWSPMGPVGINQNAALPGSHWGTVSGRVRAIAIHPTDANTAYIGAAAGGIWKTTNGGTSWSDVAASLASLSYGAIEIDPNNPNTVYAGGGEILFSTNPWLYDGHGMFKSTNGGTSWTNITSGFGSQTQFGAISVSPHNSNYVFAALGSGYWHLGNLSNEGVWRSTDAGTNWTRVLNQIDAHDVKVRPDSAGYVYAALGGSVTNSGIWRSVDNGANWTKYSDGLPTGTSIGRIQLTISESNPTTMYAILYRFGTSLWKTTDGGKSWNEISAGVTIGGNYGSGWADQGWYDLCVTAHPTDPNIVMCGNVELYRGTNGADISVQRVGGSAWFSPCHVDYHIIRFSPSNPSIAYLGSDGGVYKSTDAGATWASANNGINTIQFYQMASDPTNPNTLIGGAQDNGNFRTTDGGTTWTMTTTGDGMFCAIDPGDSNIMYASTQNGRHYKSTNGGASFTTFATTSGSWLSPLMLHPNDSRTVFITDYNVYKSTNGGSTFTTLTASMSQQIRSFDVSPANGGHMIAAGNTSFSNLGQVKVSVDSGATWSTVSGAIPGTARHITRVLCHPTQANTIFVARSGFIAGEKIYRSTDMGTTWTNITGNLPNVPHNDIIVDPIQTNDYYVANDFGVYHSTDAGATWAREGSGMPFVPTMDIDIVNFGTSRVLRAATHGRGVYESAIDPPCSGPTITGNPANQSGCVGFLATFISSATGTPTPSVVWEYSSNSGSTWLAWPGGTTPTISFTTTAGQNGYQFRAAYTSVCGSAMTTVATLTVQTPPVVTGWPGASVSVCENNSTNLFADASGNPTPSRQWQRSTNSGGTWSDLTGETSTTLSLPSIPTSWDGYQYRTRFSNVCGTVFSNVTTLTVLTNPLVTLHPSNQSVPPATLVSFTSTATSNPAPGVQWQVSTNSGATWSDVGGATSTTYSFTAQLTDNGKLYRARFTNVCTSTNSNTATLNVGSNPDIEVSVVASTLTPVTGSNMYFDVTLDNVGNAASGSISANYTAPSGMSIVSVAYLAGVNYIGILGDATQVGIGYSSIGVGGTASVRITVSVDCSLADASTLANTFTATTTPDVDLSNNSRTVNLTTDNPAPLFTVFPADMNESTGLAATTCDMVINSFGSYTTSDNCPGETVAITGVPPGNVFPVGTTVLTYTITDAGGRQTVQTQNINVADGTAPAPDVASLPQLNAECSYTLSTPPTATDNCDGTINATTTQALPWTISAQGTHTVTWTYTDANNNTSTQNQTIVIDDVTAPVPNVASLPPVTGQCDATITTYPTASDNCVGTVTGATTDPLSYSAQGTYTVTWTYDDGNGNTSTQQQTVIIDDTTPPLPDVASLPNVTGECSATITTTPTATDNCVGSVIGTTTDPLTYSTQGTFYVTWYYDDGHGNISSQVQTVIVKDITPPVATCPPGTSVEADANDQAPVPNFMIGATATDNCTAPANITWTQSPAVNSFVGLGPNAIVVTARDEANNPGSCSSTLTVIERVEIAPSSTMANVSFGCNSPLAFTRSVTINNSGGNFNSGLLQWTASTTDPQISLTASSGFEGDALAFTVSPAGLTPGTHTLNIVITAWNSVSNTPAKNSPYMLPVSIIVEPVYGGPLTQTKPVTTSWTPFTNSYGHKFAEVKSNGGTISSFTVTARTCTYPRAYPRVNFVNRYFSFSAAGAVNVDIRTYFTDTETKPRVVQPQNLTLWQQPLVPGAWWNRGGTANPGANYVEITGVTNIAGNWLPAHPWVNWFPKPLALTVTGASYNDETKTATIEWLSNIATDEVGFLIERSDVENPGDGDWLEVGMIAFNDKGEYSIADPVGQKGAYSYRISTWDSEGNYYASGVITIDAVSAPGGYALAQNYPNPFNPETMISYTLPVQGHVSIIVYDMFWREVKVLVDNAQNAGTHKTSFNALALPSGTYFYQMKAGSYIQTRKMNLTK